MRGKFANDRVGQTNPIVMDRPLIPEKFTESRHLKYKN